MTNTRKEDENARKFLESFRELYNRSYQLLENAKRITPLTPVYPQYKDEIDRQKKGISIILEIFIILILIILK